MKPLIGAAIGVAAGVICSTVAIGVFGVIGGLAVLGAELVVLVWLAVLIARQR